MIAEPKNIPLAGFFPLPEGLATVDVSHRAKFWKLLGRAALLLKRTEILEGIDRWGNRMVPVKRKWGVHVPLIPHSETSRTYDLLSLNSTARGATLFWRHGGGRESWSKILGYHAYKHGPRSLPVRNTIGLSPRSVEEIMAESEMWRAGYEAGLAASKKAVVKTSSRTIVAGPSRAETRLERVLREKRERETKGLAYAPTKTEKRSAPKPPPKLPPEPPRKPSVAPESIVATKERLAGYAKGDEKIAKIREIGSAAIDAMAKRDGAAARMKELMSSLTGTKGADRKRLKAELDAASRAHEVADLAASKAVRETRHKVLNHIGIEEKSARLGVDFKVDEGSPLGTEASNSVGGALNFISRLVANSGHPPVKVKLAGIPADEEQRAHHLGGKDGLIRVGNRNDPATLIHEVGHLLEDQVKGWGDRAREFLEYRTAGERAQSFRDVLGRQYTEHEKGRKDKFDEAFGDIGWYVGKEYFHNATEITSMAIEKLFNNPIEFVAKDPEYFKWLLGMLDGSLR